MTCIKKNLILFFLICILSSPSLAGWGVELNIPGNIYRPRYITVNDSNNAWIIGKYVQGDSSFILKRITFQVWVNLPHIFLRTNILTCLSTPDGINLFAGTENGKVYRSTDGGQNWVQQIAVGGMGYINDIQFSKINPNVGYVFSDPPTGPGGNFKIYKTTNGGNNWTEISVNFGSSYTGAYESMSVTDQNHVWLGLNCQPSFCGIPRIAFTTNGGISWQTSNIPNPSDYVSAICFKMDNSIGMTGPFDVVPTNIYRSTNLGMNWSFLHTTNQNIPIEEIISIQGTNIWYYCMEDEVYKSLNNGQNWSSTSIPPNQNDQVVDMDAIRTTNKIYGWAVTLNGAIYYLVDSISTIGIEPISSEIPEQFSLEQNYPNPFNPSTKIRFQVATPLTPLSQRGDNVRLVVFDVLGREIATLVNEELQPGTYEVDFDGSNLPSGVYYYKLVATDYTETKKMLIIK